MVQLSVLNIFNPLEILDEKIEFPDNLFYLACSESAIEMTYYVYNMQKRIGSSHTKERWAVSGTTKKAYKQKGTGRARHGTLRASQFRGGGVTFGPLNLKRKVKVNKNLRSIAAFTALMEHINKGTLIVANDFVMQEVKTSLACKALKNIRDSLIDNSSLSDDVMKNLKDRKSINCLLIGDSSDVLSNNIMLSSRNIVGVKFIHDTYLNVYDLVRNNFLVITKSALLKIINKFKDRIIDIEEEGQVEA
jgi:large subunit ribosomal protein L4